MIQGLHPDIETILAAGNQAPSGENCQPWHFIVRNENTLEVHLVPERDNSHYNWGQRASYMACGAAVENICIAASSVGYKTYVSIFPTQESTLIASIQLTKDPSTKSDTLAPEIFLRVTNRKRYAPIRLSEPERKSLTTAVESTGYGSLSLIDERNDVKRLAEIGATNEEIMLSNKELHEFFFSHVNWNKTEDDLKRAGFFIKTLELPSMATAAFYVLRNWDVMNFLMNLKIHKVIAQQNASTYAASAAIGCIAIPGEDPKDFVNCGRALERLWLTATQLGMSIQPLTGVLFFKLKVDGGEGNIFSADHQAKIDEDYKVAQKIFGYVGKRMTFMFRLGSGAVPSARAARFDLKDVVTVL